MAQLSALAELGITLDARSIRERLAKSRQEANTLRRLLRIAEHADQFADQQGKITKREVANV